jgi:hypothetical protein
VAGFLDTQSQANQAEAIYIAYFGRAADGPGYLFWTNNLATQTTAGVSAAQAAVNVAQGFAPQAESKAIYSFLASPPTVLNVNDPVQQAGVESFLQSVYQHLFNRTVPVTDAGLLFWQNAILSGSTSIGSSVYAIANGALGGDQTVLTQKIASASNFTQVTFGANLSSGAAFLAAATAAVSTVVDATTEANAVAATLAFVNGQGGSTTALTLTPGSDNLSTSVTGAVFSAPLVTTSTQVGAGSFNVQTLSVNDSMSDSKGDGTLNATFNANVVGAGVTSNVTMTGVATANLTNVSGLGLGAAAITAGFEGNISGLTTVNDNNSNSGITLGAPGSGLKSLLTNVNIAGLTATTAALGAAGAAAFQAIEASSAFTSATTPTTINVGISGGLGTKGLPIGLAFGNDGAAGTATSPSSGYATWAITAGSGNDFLTLAQNGVGSATTISLTGAGSVTLYGDNTGAGAANWANLKTVNLSASTGTETITGGTTIPIPGGPGGASFGGVGLLTNSVLTAFTGGSGSDSVDLSTMTAPQVLAMTSLIGAPSGNTTAVDTVILGHAVTTGLTAITNLTGFAVLGDAAGGAGTINEANFPGVSQITVVSPAPGTGETGLITITNGSSPLTLNLGTTKDAGFTLFQGGVSATTIGTGTSDALTVNVGSATAGNTTAAVPAGTTGALTTFGYETINLVTNGTATGIDTIGGIAATASTGGTETLNISGNAGAVFGGLIILTTAGTATTITDTDTGVLTIAGAAASTINASTSGGLFMTGADSLVGTATDASAGNTITGAAAASNELIGFKGNDTITGGSVTDTIATGGGHDAIVLGTSHISDHVAIYAGAGVPSAVTGALVNSFGAGGIIVAPGDVAQPGYWGIAATGAAATVVTGTLLSAVPGATVGGITSGGTNVDASTISSFQVGTASTHDFVDLSAGAWSGLLMNGGFTGVAAQVAGGIGGLGGGSPGNVSATVQATAGGSAAANVVAAATNLVEITGVTFAGPTQLAQGLTSTTNVFFAGALGAGGVAHVLFAYSDGANVHIADVDLHAAAASSNTTGIATGAGAAVVASDLVVLTGVSAVTSLVSHDVHFVA